MSGDRICSNSHSESTIEKLALKRNWPTLQPDTLEYEIKLRALENFLVKFGRNKFELYYNLRSPINRVEEWSRDFMQGKISHDELKTRLRHDAERPIDLEMLKIFHETLNSKLEHYSRILQAMSRVVNNQQNIDSWEDGQIEDELDLHVEAIEKKFPLWKENLQTCIDFLDELRVQERLGSVQIDEFRATSAHWLAELVLERVVEAWKSSRKIAKRSQTDPAYLYSTTASTLFFDTWFLQFPSPQHILESLREEYTHARLALKNANYSQTPTGPIHQDVTQALDEATVIRQMHSTDLSNAKKDAPTAFISYTWDDESHKEWVRRISAQLRADGVDVKLDQWETVPGDQLTQFMEKAIRENDYVLIVCTPNYKKKSDERHGGVGYEGDIITAELFTERNHRKFIPVLRDGDWKDAFPTSLNGKYGIDLRGEPYSEEQYQKMLITLHGQYEVAPPVGEPPAFLTDSKK